MFINSYLLIPLYFLVGILISMVLYRLPGDNVEGFTYLLPVCLWPFAAIVLLDVVIESIFKYNATQKDIW